MWVFNIWAAKVRPERRGRIPTGPEKGRKKFRPWKVLNLGIGPEKLLKSADFDHSGPERSIKTTR